MQREIEEKIPEKTMIKEARDYAYRQGYYHNGECPKCGDYLDDFGACMYFDCDFKSDLTKINNMQRENSICGKTILKSGMKCVCLLPNNHIGECKNSSFVIDEFGNKVQPVQRENKWKDRFRDKFGEHILKVELHDESLNEPISYSSIDNEIISFIQSEIDTAIADRDKEINEIIDNTLGNDWSDMSTMYLTIQRIINLITKEQ